MQDMKLIRSIALSAAAAAMLTLSGCGGGSSSSSSKSDDNNTETPSDSSRQVLSGNISSNMTLTSDKVWVLDGLVTVQSGATLTIEAGTMIAGRNGTGDATSYMVVDKGAKIMANGTAESPIIFTSEDSLDGVPAAVGQWGGLTIIGNAANAQVAPYEVNTNFVPGTSNMADNSGVLNHVKILNSGITMAQDKEINGLSLVGVGSGTTISNITVDLSDDDGVEIWGGTVDLDTVTITRCTDDYFDIDDGYSGTVTNLNINTTTGNAGIEMSGTTSATFDGFNITVGSTQVKEGGIFFKKDGIGGHFKNGIITDNSDNGYGAIFSQGAADIANTTFENVTIAGTSADADFTNKTDEATDSAAELEAQFNAGTGNATSTVELSGDITSNMTLSKGTRYIIDGLVAVKNNAVLTIEAGTTIGGRNGTGDATSYMVVDKGSQIIADGTAALPIIFTSEDALHGKPAAVGQWGGLTIIGNAANDQVSPYEVNTDFIPGTSNMADSSGTLDHVKILNSGITMAQDKEINGLSFVGVGSGTTVSNITVDLSDDDGVEIWGGTVDLDTVTITRCTDDYFDIDDGYSGTVTNLNINTTTGNAGIEMSGTTAATFNNFTIVVGATQVKEGGIFFKKDGIGGHFNTGTITDNSDNGYGAIFSQGAADIANTTFANVTINGSSTDARFTNKTDEATDSASELQTVFENDATNTLN